MADISPPTSNPFSPSAPTPSQSSTSAAASSASSAASSATSDTATSTTSASTSSTSSASSASSASASSVSSTSSSSATSASSTSASSQLSSSSSSSQFSGPSGSTSPPAAPTQQSSSATLIHSTDSDGSVVDYTSYVIEGPTPTGNSAAAQGTGTSKGFFENKGAVAGVFTVVGLIALVVAIAVITNAVRRRRAKRFDREIAEAAREAANAGVRPPDLDDDDDFAFGGRSVYTDGTHGAYGQAPLKHLEAYNMSELPLTSDPAQYGVAAGAGNAGVGAAGLNRARSTTTPYNAFAGPGMYQPPQAQGDAFFDSPPMPNAYSGAYGHGGPGATTDLLDAAGLGVGAAVARGPSQHNTAYGQGLARNPSAGGARALDAYTTGANTNYGAYPPPPAPQAYATPAASAQHATYAPQHQPQQAQIQYAPPPPQQHQQRPVSGAEDVYGGYADTFAVGEHDEHDEHDARDHEQYGAGQGRESTDDEGFARGYVPYAHESRASVGDDEDYGYGGGRRVLKVANE